jgi:hypothetical protein
MTRRVGAAPESVRVVLTEVERRHTLIALSFAASRGCVWCNRIKGKLRAAAGKREAKR